MAQEQSEKKLPEAKSKHRKLRDVLKEWEALTPEQQQKERENLIHSDEVLLDK